MQWKVMRAVAGQTLRDEKGNTKGKALSSQIRPKVASGGLTFGATR